MAERPVRKIGGKIATLFMMIKAHSSMSYLFYGGGGGMSILRIEYSGTKKPTGVKFLFK